MWLHESPDAHDDRADAIETRRRYARRHLALVRACGQIDALLKSHGVIGMLRGEHADGSLNSALVAVLGLALKKQDAGLRLFASEAGHARLKRDLAPYFDASPDTVEGRARIDAARAQVDQARQALAAWNRAPP